jgi:hypothetical protein
MALAVEVPTKASINGAERPISNRRRLSVTEIEAVCRLIAEKRFTDREACAKCGINERTWFRWKQKSKNDVRFSALIERLRGERLNTIIDRIDDASIGKGMKQPDWRAAAWLAQVIDRERYGDQRVISSNVTNTFNQTNNLMFNEAAKRIYGQQALPQVSTDRLTIAAVAATAANS